MISFAVILYVLGGLFCCGVWSEWDKTHHDIAWWIYPVGFLFWPAFVVVALGQSAAEVAKANRD